MWLLQGNGTCSVSYSEQSCNCRGEEKYQIFIQQETSTTKVSLDLTKALLNWCLSLYFPHNMRISTLMLNPFLELVVSGVRYGALRRGVESMCRMLSNVWRNIPRPIQHACRSTKSTKDLWLNSSRLYSKCFAIILWTEYNWKGKEEYDNIKQLISKYFFAALVRGAEYG